MKTIKFSHRYNKFPRDFQLSKLLAVLPIKLEDLGKDFLAYDTSFDLGEHLEGNYPLPTRGDYMILLLRAGSGKGQMWTTIRSQKGKQGIDKMAYYRGLIGEVLECRVTE